MFSCAHILQIDLGVYNLFAKWKGEKSFLTPVMMTQIIDLGPLVLNWINFNPNMDQKSHAMLSVKRLIHSL